MAVYCCTRSKREKKELVTCIAVKLLNQLQQFSMVLTFNFLAVLDFMNDEATDDACVVASYLSDADFLLASLSRMLTRNYEAENVVQSSATSVAVRGVLFANFHPLYSRDLCMYCFFLVYCCG